MTKLDLHHKLHSLRLKDGNSAHQHIKVMTELFDTLLVAGETISEENRVVYLRASLLESYSVLVTALKANEDVPKLEVVTERIVHQERKSRDKSEAGSTTESAMTSRKAFRRKLIKCHLCGELGHIKKYCRDLKAEKEGRK